MSSSNNLESENNNFNQGNYFLDSVDEGKFDMTEDIYTSLDLNVEDGQHSANSNNDDEFDLDKIREEALANADTDNTPCSESSEQINNFPEIDLLVTSEQNKTLSEEINEIFSNPDKVVDVTSNNYKENKSQEDIETTLEMANNLQINENNIEIESPDYEPMSPNINKESSDNFSMPDEFNMENNNQNNNNNVEHNEKEVFLKIKTNVNSESFECGEIMKNNIEVTLCNLDKQSVPSPFLSSFTPPPSPSGLIITQFKREKSVEITDNIFESDYFEDDNINNFQSEEVYTDEINSIFDDDCNPEIEEIEDFSNENSNERNYQMNAEDIIMNDHNYFNQEQNITNIESYINHTNILNNSLNVFIKSLTNYHKIPELIYENNEVQEKLKEVFHKMDIFKNSIDNISHISKDNENNHKKDCDLKSQIEKNIKKENTVFNNDEGINQVQFDSAISQALKKFEPINAKHEDIMLIDDLKEKEKKNLFSEKIDNFMITKEDDLQDKFSIVYDTIDHTPNLLEINSKQFEESKPIKDITNEHNNNVIQKSAIDIQDKLPSEEIVEERPWTKLKALTELAKTIIEFSQIEHQKDVEIEDFFKKICRNFNEIIIYPALLNASVQTEYTGKIFSEKRLKSINEKEKRRLLDDFSDSSDISSEYESENENNSKNEVQTNLNNDEQENILNGIDFSKYLDSSNGDSDDFPNDFSAHLDVILEEEDEVLQEINEHNFNKKVEISVENNGKTLENELVKKNLGNQKLNSNTKIEESKEISNLKDVDSNHTGDKEIDRLLDFKGLESKRIQFNYGYVTSDKKRKSKKNAVTDISKILTEDEIKESSDGTDTEEEDCIANEKTYLIRQNENLKKQLLESSCSSDSENDCDITIPDDIDDEDDDEEFNENKPTLVEKFLETYVETEEDNDKSSGNEKKLNGEHFSELDGILEKPINITNEKEPTENRKSVTDLENKENDVPDEDSDKLNASSDCEILDKTFATLKEKNKKRKSLDTLIVEDQRRRKNLKISDEIFSLSSDDESDTEERKTKKTEPHRIIRPIMKTEQLTSETKKAQKEEQGRLNRLKKKENILKKAYKEHNKDPSDIREIVLDYSTKTKKFITVHNNLVSHLKQHQIDGVKFMYDCCYGSVNFIDEFQGSGCILAHCMGLGKTLQLITLIHTLVTHKDLKTSKLLILCPKSTVMNWAEEIQRWLGPLDVKNLKVFTFNDVSDISDKLSVLQEWHSCGSIGSHNSGCLLIGYEAFRTLVSYPNKKNRNPKLDLQEIKTIIKKTLLDPGADLVVCDEGHIIKNRRAAISQAVTEIRTFRRIVLTGTPIQNNLKEYYSMVNFIKPSYLGTEKEFANVYANPIKNGQHKDSSKRDIKIMKQRSFVLHSKLSSFVQRREAALLKTFLPQKFEYVLFIPLSPCQEKLYEIFLEAVGKRDDTEKKGRNLLTDYTCLRKIWTHPKVLENAYNNAIMLKNKKDKKLNLELASDEDQPDDIYDSQTGLMSVTSDWWRQHLTEQDLKSILPSHKLLTMFEILRMCAESREKCLIFSAFVAVLNVVEFFMDLINKKHLENVKDKCGIDRFDGPWINGKDYYRLDGKTPKSLRHEMVKSFNEPSNNRARVFLISAKAGGQGINLIGANRVIILDTSWNPSNDQQNIFRIFRLGQKKKCYIYRLISSGTMEEKVYSRSVTKQAMSFRVVDEHQIDRHYSMAELAELYKLTKPDYSNRPIPNLPQDNILAHLLRNFPQYIFKYHEHDSLLENKIEQELSEQEKEDAWSAYECEINSNANAGLPNFHGLEMFGGPPLGLPALENFARSSSSTDIFNQGRVPVTSPQFFPGYNFPNKNYLENMFSYFSNTNPLYGGIDLTKSPVYGDSISSNYLLPNNRPPGSNMGLVNPPVSSPNFPSLDPLHIPTSHPNTYNQNLPPYNSLYSNASSLLNNPLRGFNNTSLENFKRVFENYVNTPSTVPGLYNSNQNKTNNDLRTKTTDLNNTASKNEMNSYRKHNMHPNFNASLATSSSGSMTNSILNAQNRLINQSSSNDLNVSLKRNSPGISITNSQKDNRISQSSVTSQFSKQSTGNNSSSNNFALHPSKVTNNQTRPSNKTSSSEVKKTDTLRNTTLDLLKNDSLIQNRISSPKTTANDSNERTGNKNKPMATQKTNMVKNLSNQSLLTQTSSIKNASISPTNKIPSLALGQNHSISNNNNSNSTNLSQSSPKISLKHTSNLMKSTPPQSLSNASGVVGKIPSKNLSTSRGRTNSPTYIDTLLRKSADLSNLGKNKSHNPLALSSKSNTSLNKSTVQLNQDGQKGSTSNSSIIPMVNKILKDPLSSSVEDKLMNAGISISKKPSNLKIDINSANAISKQTNQILSTQLQDSLAQRKRPLIQDNKNRTAGPSIPNRLDPISKRPKLTPKELADELSSSLKRIQSSKGLTIVHKSSNKGSTSSSGDVLEVD